MSVPVDRGRSVADAGRDGPVIMGVLNVTPDSFSDGGLYLEPESALLQARALVAQGAHVIDVGGESTRPGAARVSPDTEQHRVLPVIRALASEGLTVSIDTVNSSTARRAVDAGASIINDVSGGTADPMMRSTAADTGATFIVMHWRGIPDLDNAKSAYGDVVVDVRDHLARLAEAAIHAGVQPERLILDPGFGFDKTPEQGWRLLSHLPNLTSLGYPLLVGVSRKRMIAAALAHRGLPDNTPMRDAATATVSALAVRAGAWGVRVHDVASTAAALAVSDAWGLPGDQITLTGLEVFAHHGVFDFERQEGQRFLIDAEICLNLHPAAHSDALDRTVNYAELADALKQAAETDPVDLIETLAERLAAVALSFRGVTQARITVHKPDAPIDATFDDVAVTVVRNAAHHHGGRVKS